MHQINVLTNITFTISALENLEWATPSTNQRDRLPYRQQKKRYLDELLEGCVPIAQYKGYIFIDYYYNPSTEEFMKTTKKGYQVICLNHLYHTFCLTDTNNVKHQFGHQRFVRTFQP